MHHETTIVKTRSRNSKFNRFHNAEPSAIPDLWRELCGLASLVPAGEAGAVHRLRSQLLDSVPTHLIPEFLESLVAERATA